MKNTYSKIKLAAIILLTACSSSAFGQSNTYQIYALKFALLKFKLPIAYSAVGSTSKDSSGICYMIYLLKGNNGRTILVDAGFTETPAMYNMHAFNYIRPDSMLRKINIDPKDITDLIVTHPHWDHIDGIGLFPNAHIWIQKEDFNYFVGAAWQKPDGNSGFNKRDVLKTVELNLAGVKSAVLSLKS